MSNLPLPESTMKTKGSIAWMAGHSVAANLVMVALIFGGLMWARNIKQEVFPSFDRDSVRISVAYPGASPEEVEKGIVLGIEDAVNGLDGVDEVRSVANESSCRVTVDALTGTNMQKLMQDIQKEVDGISTFPQDIEEPQISVSSHKRQVLQIAIYGDTEDTVLREISEQVRDELLQDPGITQLDLTGVRPHEISIEISQESLRRYNLTIEKVAARLRDASVELPGGGIKTSAGEILVRIKERRDYGQQFARLPIISTPDGSQVLLGDIAQIKDGFEDIDRRATYNGMPAVMLEVYRVGSQTPIQISETVHQLLEKINRSFPKGINAKILNDRSDIYRQRIELLLRNGALGLGLVLVILAIFLEARLAFWVMMGIPISFLGSFLVLPMIDTSINMISLFAYIIALGIVVDDAIVIGENVYHYHKGGLPFKEAAIKGSQEMAMPVTFSILTNVAAFIPLALVPGTMGKIFIVIPAVVITVFLISLAECLYILPAHLGHLKERKGMGMTGWFHKKQQAFSNAFYNFVRNVYGPFLDFTLRNRYLTITIAFSVLVLVLAYAASGRMGFQLFPKVEADFSMLTLNLPYGSPVEKTEKIMQHIEESARRAAGHINEVPNLLLEDEKFKEGFLGKDEKIGTIIVIEADTDKKGTKQTEFDVTPEGKIEDEYIEGIFAVTGDSGSHTGRIIVFLADADVRARTMSTDEFTNRWRKEVGEIPGIESIMFQSDAGGPGSGHAMTVELNHRDIGVLEKASGELAEMIKMYPRVKDVDDGFQPGKQQMDFTVTPEGKSLGLTAREVARQIRNAFYGKEVLRQQRGRNRIKVMVRLPEAERISEHSIDELLITTPAGTMVPLREVSNIKYGRSYTTINRRSGRRVVRVGADTSPRSRANEILGDLRVTALPGLVEKHPGLRYSFEGKSASMRDSLGSLKTTFLFAMLAIYALLAIPFRSYFQPLIVMASIPYGIIGACIGHLIMGYSLSLLSMFGIVALSGVVVNDALIMVDAANRYKKKRGGTSHDMIHAAGIQRFRPIILTTLTTSGGLAPMIFETSRQARFLIPMAISLGFGILFATLITLILVPSLYMIVEDFGSLKKRIFG